MAFRDDEKIFRRRLQFANYSEKEVRTKFRIDPDRLVWLRDRFHQELDPSTRRSHAVSAETKLLSTLRYMATGSLFEVTGDTVGVSKSSVSRYVGKVVPLVAGLAADTIRMPETIEEIRACQNAHYEIAGMPFVIGCVDGTLINILAPQQHEMAFVDRHQRHSMNVMAVSTPDHRFAYVNAEWPGSANDAFVFNNSPLLEALEAGRFTRQPFSYLLGDSAYALRDCCVTPFLRPANAAERAYNAAHTGTRYRIETLFGQWKAEFRLLSSKRGGVINLEPGKAAQVIAAAAVVHNWHKMDGIPDVDPEDPDDDDDELNGNHHGQGLNVRNEIVRRYFVV